MKNIIQLRLYVGNFAENKDIAKKIRIETIMPALLKREDVVLNFGGVTGATQSFVHALISDPIRQFHAVAFDHLFYQEANDDIREIISIVYRYMQESLDEDE